MQKILENFLEISKIRRCSYQTQEMEEFLIDFAKKFDYTIKVDKAKNILIYKNNPKIALQAHYDMVCVGEAPNIQLEIKDNIIRAKNSSLGADNGIAIAMMMMELIKERVDAEFLFTNDEEVGLIGAKNLELSLKSRYLLNLDSEDEATIYIGCAGGADIVGEYEDTLVESNLTFYEVAAKNLPGGHSGVDINKNIPNANNKLLEFIIDNNLQIAQFKGGERINSIAANATAVVGALQPIKSNSLVEVKPLNKKFKIVEFDPKIIFRLKYGPLRYNQKFNVVEDSRNLSIIEINSTKIEIKISNRSLKNENLDALEKEVKEIFKDFKIETIDRYFAWKPEVNSFSKKVKETLKKEFKDSSYEVIHAGLECGVLKEKYPNMEFASIGPNIFFPHSKKEYCEIDSINKTFKALEQLIEVI